MAYSRKKQPGGDEDNAPGVFRFFTLPLKIPDQTKFQPKKLCKIVFTLRNFKA